MRYDDIEAPIKVAGNMAHHYKSDWKDHVMCMSSDRIQKKIMVSPYGKRDVVNQGCNLEVQNRQQCLKLERR